MPENIRAFGSLPDGGEVLCVSLRGGGLECEVLNYGGALRSLVVPSRRGPAGRGAGLRQRGGLP